MKLACDFVSAYNLQEMAALRPMQRVHRLQNGGAEDVLQLPTLLWYAWLSISTFKVPATSNPLGCTGERGIVTHAITVHGSLS